MTRPCANKPNLEAVFSGFLKNSAHFGPLLRQKATGCDSKSRIGDVVGRICDRAIWREIGKWSASGDGLSKVGRGALVFERILQPCPSAPTLLNIFAPAWPLSCGYRSEARRMSGGG